MTMIDRTTCWPEVVPKDDSGLFVSEAVFYGSPLSIPGQFLGSLVLPLTSFLRKIENPVARFAVPLPHHVRPSPPRQLLPALRAAEFVFVREDASVPGTSVSWTLSSSGAER